MSTQPHEASRERENESLLVTKRKNINMSHANNESSENKKITHVSRAKGCQEGA